MKHLLAGKLAGIVPDGSKSVSRACSIQARKPQSFLVQLDKRTVFLLIRQVLIIDLDLLGIQDLQCGKIICRILA